jgi:hypothetical protein
MWLQVCDRMESFLSERKADPHGMKNKEQNEKYIIMWSSY